MILFSQELKTLLSCKNIFNFRGDIESQINNNVKGVYNRFDINGSAIDFNLSEFNNNLIKHRFVSKINNLESDLYLHFLNIFKTINLIRENPN